jgi:hypothetical protein
MFCLESLLTDFEISIHWDIKKQLKLERRDVISRQAILQDGTKANIDRGSQLKVQLERGMAE